MKFNPSLADEALSRFLAIFSGAVILATQRQRDSDRDPRGGSDPGQVAVRQLAQLATNLETARSQQVHCEGHPQSGAERQQAVAELTWVEALLHARTVADRFSGLLQQSDHGSKGTAALLMIRNSEVNELLHSVDCEATYRAIGRGVLDEGSELASYLSDAEPVLNDLIATTRRFADTEVTPVAQEIHRQDLLVPENIVTGMADLGLFGASIPEEYGGVGIGNLPMILVTETLSAASLPAAGSLITRPEVLAKALLAGGTEAQKKRILPPVAAGQLMVAVAVTEPDTGSDVANIRCKAVPGEVDGEPGWLISGNKAWCTFSGRANLLALLARTDPDPAAGHRGLSLFVVEKEPFSGHQFEMRQPGGGTIIGKADDTMGYRGMHSFSLQFDNYFVPQRNLVGEEAGLGRGFYYQMAGFAAGRLQTGGRAVGLGSAALQAAVSYCKGRRQFGQPLADFENTHYQIGEIYTRLQAARQLTYRAARAMDQGSSAGELLAAMAKLKACRMAVDVSQAAQLLHGGWGYAEEFPIARYVADSLVLPIFEGVEPILEMKVIGRQLLKDAAATEGSRTVQSTNT